MKKIIIFTLVLLGIVAFTTTGFAVSTIDYNFSINSPVYRSGEDVWGDKLTGNASIGKSFQKSYGKVNFGGNISGVPLNKEIEDLSEYMSLSGRIDWFDAGALRGALNTDTFSLTYRDHPFGNDNISASIGNVWHFSEENTTQRLTFSSSKDLKEDKGTISFNANLNTKNLKETESATISVSYSGSFNYSDGQTLNTSIVPEVYTEEERKPVSGVTLNLLADGEVVKQIKTSEGGSASFGELDAGTYTVQLAVSSLPDRFEVLSDREVEVSLEDNEIEKVKFEVQKSVIEERTTFSGDLEDEE